MKKFKLLSVIITGLMMLSVFAGCSTKKDDPASSNKPSNSQAQDPYDKLPKEITVAIFDRGQVPPDKGTYENNDVTKWINENSPVKVKFIPIPRWETSQKYNIMLAAGEAPDIFMEFQPEMVQDFVNNGSLMELGPLIDKYGPNLRKLTPPEVKKWAVYNGKEYGVPQIRSEVAVANWMTWVRQDWLDNLSLKMPTTMEEFYQVAKAFRENDPDKNGKKDTFGYSLAWSGDGRISNLFGAMPGTWIPGSDGALQHVSVSENQRDAVEFMKKLYDEDIIDKEFFTDKTGSKTQQDFVTNKLGFFAAGTGYVNTFWGALKKNVPGAKVAPVPSVKVPKGQFGYYQEREVALINMIPTTCKNPKAAIMYLDWMISNGWEKIKYGVEGTHYKKENGVIISTYDDATWKKDLIYRGDYPIISNENIKAKELASKFASADETTKQAKAYEALAIETTFKVPFVRHTPTNNLGLKIITEKMPDMQKFADETWLKAIVGGKSMTPDQALKAIRDEWDKMGYPEVKKQFNEAAKKLK